MAKSATLKVVQEPHTLRDLSDRVFDLKEDARMALGTVRAASCLSEDSMDLVDPEDLVEMLRLIADSLATLHEELGSVCHDLSDLPKVRKGGKGRGRQAA